MKRTSFLFISASLSIGFGGIMFLLPKFASKNFDMIYSPETGSLLRGMGGLIIGTGLINMLLRNSASNEALKALFITNIVTQLLGIITDFWGVYDGALVLKDIFPIQITHLFIGAGSIIYLLRLDKQQVEYL